MRARTFLPLLALLSACAAPATSRTARAPDSPASRARPEPDPTLLQTPQGASSVLPIEQVSVRVQRAQDGRLTIVEFLSPGLPESEQVAMRLAFQSGKLRLADEGTSGEASWITTLLRDRSR
jgi:hypothetical protein